ncbi:uncharacterized protein LOC118200187 [Stegodyphus dumicola]|uniref:uncharacterized protein LOC118200187 n=1 Tax=Stegodyphus dumicola TaxID=202533 RepID=UPI0015B116CD|nr:uncharacterized protein LOC118200187 [Stegodyphus dumicola]
MDDVLSGAEDLEKTKELQNQLVNLLSQGGMKLHIWFTNHRELLLNVNTKTEDYSFSNEIKNETTVLGILWNPDSDAFTFNVTTNFHDYYTKRHILSAITRIFDPLGLIGPVITKAKIFMQKLWLLKIGWNDVLPETESHEWKNFITSMPKINGVIINRKILSSNAVKIEMHGFSDASELAYGACIYVKCILQSGSSSVVLLCSKSRVAPLKSVSIPRLELCGAVLLSQLMDKV